MVLPFKRDRRSLSSDRSIQEKLAPSKMVRSARTPPSTFLFLLFSFQTARSRSATFTRNSIPETRWSTGRRFATDDRSAANSLISMRSIRDENARQCQRPWRRRVNGWVIGPAIAACQRQSQQIVASPSAQCDQPGTGPIFSPTPYLSHIVATS
jgi:hypothetical protein